VVAALRSVRHRDATPGLDWALLLVAVLCIEVWLVVGVVVAELT